MQTRRVSLGLIFALGVVGFAGCGPKGGQVKGTLVLPANVKLAENDAVQVSLIPESGKDTPPPGEFTVADMSFQLKGIGGRGVPAGKYKVSVMVQPYGGADAKRKPLFEALNEKYNPGKTPLTYDVTGDSVQTITIDLTKGAVTKQ
jgi:hypothetical protein